METSLYSTTKALVFLYDRLAGVLERDSNGWVVFTYNKQYAQMSGPPLSLSLPVREEPFRAKGLPAYFQGLCSEGWLRRTQCFEQGIHPSDEFTLLVRNGTDCAGAVSIRPYPELPTTDNTFAKSTGAVGFYHLL